MSWHQKRIERENAAIHDQYLVSDILFIIATPVFIYSFAAELDSVRIADVYLLKSTKAHRINIAMRLIIKIIVFWLRLRRTNRWRLVAAATASRKPGACLRPLYGLYGQCHAADTQVSLLHYAPEPPYLTPKFPDQKGYHHPKQRGTKEYRQPGFTLNSWVPLRLVTSWRHC